MSEWRISNHPILGNLPEAGSVTIHVDGKPLRARAGDTVSSALLANGIRIHRYTRREHAPRGIFCGIGQCTDCMMVIDGQPNVRSCITRVTDGMRVETQQGSGHWGHEGSVNPEVSDG